MQVALIESDTLAVITAVPAATPLTVPLFTVATAVLLDNHVTVLAGDGRLLLDIMNADGCRHNRIRMIKTLYYCADGEIKPVDRNTLTGTVPR